jgi:transcriptional regulator with XRE-family HTH domain
MTDILTEFGETIRAIRKSKGWSQEELAEASGLHRTYIGSIERGEQNVSLKNIKRLADALGVPIANLFASPARARKR